MSIFLINPSDPKAISPRGRTRHGLFCIAFAAGLLAVLVIGGWIAKTFFQMLLLFSVTLLGYLTDANGQLSYWIWIPFASVAFLVWLALVALPALWAILGFVEALLGAASAIRPSLATAPVVIYIASAAAKLSMWVGLRFRK